MTVISPRKEARKKKRALLDDIMAFIGFVALMVLIGLLLIMLAN